MIYIEWMFDLVKTFKNVHSYNLFILNCRIWNTAYYIQRVAQNEMGNFLQVSIIIFHEIKYLVLGNFLQVICK